MEITERASRAGKATEQSNFSKGYQAALQDIRAKLTEGGAEAVREWLTNNIAS